MTRVELEMYVAVPSEEFNTYWIPSTWFISLLKQARRSHRITDPQGLKIIMEEFNEFRSKCGMLWSYDWVSIPLVYTQVVTIATYSFFLAALVGRQYVEGANKPFQMEIDTYIPVFTILQFFFFMGLLKVAEQLINPFGDDDEDFELNWLIDRHTKVSYLGVDILMTRSPPLVKDMYFDDVDMMLPYTEAAVAYKKKTYRGSVHDMMVPEEKHGMYLPEIVEEMPMGSPTPGAHTPRNSTINLFSGTTMLSPYDTENNISRRCERTSMSPQPRVNNNNAESSAGTRRSKQQPQDGGENLGADLYAMLSEVDRQQRECQSNATTPRRDSAISPFNFPQSLYLGDSMSRRSSSVASEDPDSISINSALQQQASHRSRLRSCPKLLLVKRKHSGNGKKNVRWRAISQARPPPPSPDNSIGALVEHSTSFMLQQFINPPVQGDEVSEEGREDACSLNHTEPAVSRSMPNIGAVGEQEQVDEEIWATPSPPPRWKKKENVDDGPWP